MRDVVLVLGYNNTRINDVRKIRQKAKENLGALTVLCKKDPAEDDRVAVDYAIDVGLENTPENVKKVIEECKSQQLKIVALLPFSDPGTQLGAGLASSLNLRGPSPAKARSALDKAFFREQESAAANAPKGYKKVTSQKVTSLEELQALYKKLDGKLFLKPAREGNSRGCIDIGFEHDLDKAWTEVSKYLSGGVVVEELISNAQEYSWDHVCGYSWVTEKETTHNEYRAEVQQIVPAPLDQEKASMIRDAGLFMSELSGSNQGACHNEVFYLAASHNVAAVEPNLRPAGMRIWDLSALAFDAIDPWKEWLLWASGKKDAMPKELHQKYFAGIRMIQASQNGVIEKINTITLEELSDDKASFVEVIWTKKVGDAVTQSPKDNSEFIGYVIAKANQYSDLAAALKNATSYLQKQVLIK